MALKRKITNNGLLEFGERDPDTGTRFERFTPADPVPVVKEEPKPLTVTARPGVGLPTKIIEPAQDIDATRRRQLESRTAAPDEAQIRQDIARSFQPQIDLIKNQAQEDLRKQIIENRDIAGQGRAISARRGLTGSDFGAAHAGKISAFGQQKLDFIDQQKNLKIASIFSKIDQRASDRIEAEKTKVLTAEDEFFDFLTGQETEARDDVALVAKGGITLEELDPADRQEMMKQTGFDDDFLFDAFYNENLPVQAKIDWDKRVIGNTLIWSGIDPVTGQLKTMEKTMPEGVDDLLIIDNIPYNQVKNADGTIRLVKAAGFEAIPEDPTIPTIKEINGVTSQWNPVTQEWDALETEPTLKEEQAENLIKEGLEGKITLINEALESEGISRAVGTTPFSRIFSLPGEKENFVATVQQLADIEFLDKLIQVKSAGATFGALSDAEGRALRAAATKIGSWAVKDKTGKVKRYDISEKFLIAELNKLKEGYEKAKKRIDGSYNSIEDYYKTNPEEREKVEQMINENPELTDDEILQVLTEDFSNDLGKSENYLGNYGSITAFGSSLWKHGLDIDLKKGDPVFSPIAGSVIKVGVDGGFGNQVRIRGIDGKEYWLSHLDGFDVNEGDKIGAGSKIGLGGNTGRTIPGAGGDGSHLDITIKDKNGNFISPREVHKLLA